MIRMFNFASVLPSVTNRYGKANNLKDELVIAWNSGRIINQWDKFLVSSSQRLCYYDELASGLCFLTVLDADRSPQAHK